MSKEQSNKAFKNKESKASGSLKNASSVSKKGRKPLIVALVCFLIALLALGVVFYRYWVQQNAYSDLESHVEVSDPHATKLSDLTADWEELQKINPDIVGWIYIPNSSISYPIVQGPDNQKYLKTAFDGSDGWFSNAGTIFIDYKNNAQFLDQNSFVYGHHMRDGSMFAQLADWEDDESFNQHRDIYILTPNGNFYLKTFALIKTTGSEYIVIRNFDTQEQYSAYIQDKLDRSIVKQQGEVFSASDIKQSIALSTCEYTQNDGRDVLYASVVETTAPNANFVECNPNALSGLGEGQMQTFSTNK